RFCLEQLITLRPRKKPRSFCDIGTGSGILAIAAAKLGYNGVEAFDYDADCVRIARENIRQNDVEDAIRLYRGDAARIEKPDAERFDVVAANLMFDLLLSARDQILG